METINNLESQVTNFFYSIEIYMSMTKLAFIFIVLALVILLGLVISINSKIQELDKKLEKIINIESMKEEKDNGLDVSDQHVKDLIILSKSNNKFHAENAKKELELIKQKGENINGTDDVGSNEWDNSSS